MGLPRPLLPGPAVRRHPGLGGAPGCHRGGGVHPGHPAALGHAVLARRSCSSASRATPTPGAAVGCGTSGQLWPHLAVLVHGGVAFAPYADVFEEWLGRRLPRVEVYPASEGFVGVQTETAGGLTLMLDYGIFYEFVPVEDLGAEAPRRHTVAEVELGRSYAVVMSTPAGLWSYTLGDTVRFTAPGSAAARDHRAHAPLRERLRGERDRRGGGARAGARLPPHRGGGGGVHGGAALAERGRAAGRARVAGGVPGAPDASRRTSRGSSTRRSPRSTPTTAPSASGSVGMVAPTVTALPAGTFHRWMRKAGRSATSTRSPRVTNDRTIASAAAGREWPGDPSSRESVSRKLHPAVIAMQHRYARVPQRDERADLAGGDAGAG